MRGRDHLVENKRIRDYITASLPEGTRTFGDLKVPMFVTICHLSTETLYVYGDDPTALLVDAVITSSAVPGFFPANVSRGAGVCRWRCGVQPADEGGCGKGRDGNPGA